MISVIVPIYNIQDYLEECIKDILNQTFIDFELILVDDGSKDNSGKICDEYALKDERIRVFHKENGGVSSTRNLGLSVAQGEYIAFVDGDDKIENDYLEKLYEGIKDSDADVCLCKFDSFCDGKFYPKAENYLKTYINNKNNDDYFQSFLKYYLAPCVKNANSCQMGTVWRMLFKKEKFTHKFNEKVSMAEDLLFVLNNFANVNKINVLQEVLYHYRVNNSSAMHKYRKDYYESQKAFLAEFEQFLLRLNLTDKKMVDRVIVAQKALYVSFLFGNEIRYKKSNPNFKKDISNYKKQEVYSYLTLSNFLKIKYREMKIKYLAVWVFVKFNLYKIM